MKTKSILFVTLILFVIGCKKPHTTEPPQNNNKVKRNFEWSVDTLKREQQQVNIRLDCLWGTSPNNVWGTSEASLYHFDGIKWNSVLFTPSYNWPYFGSDEYGNYANHPSSVTGFDSNHVIVTNNRYYLSADTSLSSVLRWDGSTWTDVPFTNKRPRWFRTLKKENDYRAWAITANGRVVKYENGVCTTEPLFVEEKYGNFSLAVTDDGYVYVNSRRDSVKDGNLFGTIFDLFRRELNGVWSLIEHKLVIGNNYDENGLGGSLYGIQNKLLTTNRRSIWELLGSGWTKISPSLVNNVGGGACLIDENNLWFYHQQDLYNYNGTDWEAINIPNLDDFPSNYLYGQGWSDGNEIFIPLIGSKTYVLHGKIIK